MAFESCAFWYTNDADNCSWLFRVAWDWWIFQVSVAISSSMLVIWPSRPEVLSFSFCISYLTSKSYFFIPLSWFLSSVIEVLHFSTAMKISLKLCTPNENIWWMIVHLFLFFCMLDSIQKINRFLNLRKFSYDRVQFRKWCIILYLYCIFGQILYA